MLDPDAVIAEFEKMYGGKLRCTACAWNDNQILGELYSLDPLDDGEPLPVVGSVCRHCGRLLLFVPKAMIPPQ